MKGVLQESINFINADKKNMGEIHREEGDANKKERKKERKKDFRFFISGNAFKISSADLLEQKIMKNLISVYFHLVYLNGNVA